MSEPAVISLPFTALRFLYKSTHGDKIVCEIDVGSLKAVNEPSTIDDMVAEARLEYFAGKTKGFRNMDKLVDNLNS